MPRFTNKKFRYEKFHEILFLELVFTSEIGLAKRPTSRKNNSPTKRASHLACGSLEQPCPALQSHQRKFLESFLLKNEMSVDLHISGPYGSFLLQHEPDRELLFIGTGTGIAPLWSMMTTLLAKP